MKNNEVILHGECMVFPSNLPAKAKKKKIKNSYIIVADSETTGNHHVVDAIDGVDFYEDEKGTLSWNLLWIPRFAVFMLIGMMPSPFLLVLMNLERSRNMTRLLLVCSE
jgi:hypothetical protein